MYSTGLQALPKCHLFCRCKRNTLLRHFVPSNNAKRETYLHSAECYIHKKVLGHSRLEGSEDDKFEEETSDVSKQLFL